MYEPGMRPVRFMAQDGGDGGAGGSGAGDGGDGAPKVEMTHFKGNGIEFDIPKSHYDAISGNFSLKFARKDKEFRELQNRYRELEDQMLSQQPPKPTDPPKKNEVYEMEIQKRDKSLAEIKKAHDDLSRKYNDMLKRMAITDAISRSGFQVVNQKQVELLLNSEFNFDLIQDNSGTDMVVAKKGEDFITVDDAVKSFLASENNAHFILSGLKSGTGTHKGGHGTGAKPSQYKRVPQKCRKDRIYQRWQRARMFSSMSEG
jgi:hypothetical protein